MGTRAPYPLRHHQEGLNIEKTNARPGFRGKPAKKAPLGFEETLARVSRVGAALKAGAARRAPGGGGGRASPERRRRHLHPHGPGERRQEKKRRV